VKVFVSADIEGVAGITSSDEARSGITSEISFRMMKLASPL